MNRGSDQTHAPSEDETEHGDADAEPREGVVEQELVPAVRRQVLRIPLSRLPVTGHLAVKGGVGQLHPPEPQQHR